MRHAAEAWGRLGSAWITRWRFAAACQTTLSVPAPFEQIGMPAAELTRCPSTRAHARMRWSRLTSLRGQGKDMSPGYGAVFFPFPIADAQTELKRSARGLLGKSPLPVGRAARLAR